LTAARAAGFPLRHTGDAPKAEAIRRIRGMLPVTLDEPVTLEERTRP
jgi:hypothetical protein